MKRVLHLGNRIPLVAASFPLDFYRFRHTSETVVIGKKKRALSRPLWIVGISPFDQVISSDSGYVLHLGEPRFMARWTMLEDMMEQIKTPDYFDEDLNIMLYEATALDNEQTETPQEIREWFMEAVCAIAYSKGLIAISSGTEEHSC